MCMYIAKLIQLKSWLSTFYNFLGCCNPYYGNISSSVNMAGKSSKKMVGFPASHVWVPKGIHTGIQFLTEVTQLWKPLGNLWGILNMTWNYMLWILGWLNMTADMALSNMIFLKVVFNGSGNLFKVFIPDMWKVGFLGLSFFQGHPMGGIPGYTWHFQSPARHPRGPAWVVESQ